MSVLYNSTVGIFGDAIKYGDKKLAKTTVNMKKRRKKILVDKTILHL